VRVYRVVIMVISKIERLKKEMDRAISEGDLDLALAVTDDMVNLDPDVPIHHVSKGVIMAKLGDIEGAIEELDNALEIDDQDDKAWYSKGCVLMEDGRTRPALACFYKSLDIDPSQKRVRDRFNRCLDQMIGETVEEPESKEVYFEGPKLISEDRKDFIPDQDEEIEEEEEEEPEKPIRKKKNGSYLDEDLFSDEDDDEDDDDEENEDEHEDGDLEEVEDWGDDDDEEDDDDSDWVDEDEDDEELASSIKCRCGSTINIHSDDRPYRFKCGGCGRTGTLK